MLFLYPGCMFLPSCKVQSSRSVRFLDRFWDHKIILWKQCKWAISARLRTDKDEIFAAVLLDTLPPELHTKRMFFFTLQVLYLGGMYIRRCVCLYGERYPIPARAIWKHQQRALPAPRRDFSFTLAQHLLFLLLLKWSPVSHHKTGHVIFQLLSSLFCFLLRCLWAAAGAAWMQWLVWARTGASVLFKSCFALAWQNW